MRGRLLGTDLILQTWWPGKVIWGLILHGDATVFGCPAGCNKYWDLQCHAIKGAGAGHKLVVIRLQMNKTQKHWRCTVCITIIIFTDVEEELIAMSSKVSSIGKVSCYYLIIFFKINFVLYS